MAFLGLTGLARSGFALGLAWRYRRVLSGFLKKAPPCCVATILDVAPENWYQAGIRTLVLDFDGVLSFHQGDGPLPAVDLWLAQAQRVFTDAVFVLSNLPTPARQDLFKTRYPEIHFLRSPRKKPYPEGLQAILDKTGCAPQQVLVVDDRLLTGMVLAASLGCRGCWVTKPYQHFRAHPIQESFFAFLRWADQVMLKMMLLF